MCVPFCLYVHSVHAVSVQDRRARQTPRTEVTSNCELHNVGAGSQTRGLCKSSKVLLTKPSLQPRVSSYQQHSHSSAQSHVYRASAALLTMTVDSSALGGIFEVCWIRPLCLHGPFPENGLARSHLLVCHAFY